jgi:hypothetical protein
VKRRKVRWKKRRGRKRDGGRKRAENERLGGIGERAREEKRGIEAKIKSTVVKWNGAKRTTPKGVDSVLRIRERLPQRESAEQRDHTPHTTLGDTHTPSSTLILHHHQRHRRYYHDHDHHTTNHHARALCQQVLPPGHPVPLHAKQRTPRDRKDIKTFTPSTSHPGGKPN